MAIKIFCCYAHEDEQYLKRLRIQLKPYQWKGLIDIWHDGNITAGMEWEEEISIQLDAAQIILLLVSPDFMASDYCYGIEMKRALERHKRKEARVIPIILRPSSWEGVLGKLHALPTDGKPIASWPSLDDAFFNVEKGISKVIEEISLLAGSQISSPAKHLSKTTSDSIATPIINGQDKNVVSQVIYQRSVPSGDDRHL